VNVRRSVADKTVNACGLAAIACSLLAVSCVSFNPPDSFQSVDPAGRMHAASRAAATGDQTAIPELVDMLASDDPAERLIAISTLEKLTGERLGYDPTGYPSSREAAIARWRKRLAVAGARGGGNDPATVVGGKTDR
jgi:HEAT repeat protein